MVKPKRIRKVRDLEKFRGQAIKFSRDGGRTWQYGKLRPETTFHDFDRGGSGYTLALEVGSRGVPMDWAITDRDFQNPDFRAMTTTDKEVAGKKWSYGV